MARRAKWQTYQKCGKIQNVVSSFDFEIFFSLEMHALGAKIKIATFLGLFAHCDVMVEQPQMKKVFAFCIVLEMNS